MTNIRRYAFLSGSVLVHAVAAGKGNDTVVAAVVGAPDDLQCAIMDTQVWSSGGSNVVAMQGFANGTNATRSNFVLNFTFAEQQGCTIAGVAGWSSGEISGTDSFVGAITPSSAVASAAKNTSAAAAAGAGNADNDDTIQFVLIEIDSNPDSVGQHSDGRVDGAISADGSFLQYQYMGRQPGLS